MLERVPTQHLFGFSAKKLNKAIDTLERMFRAAGLIAETVELGYPKQRGPRADLYFHLQLELLAIDYRLARGREPKIYYDPLTEDYRGDFLEFVADHPVCPIPKSKAHTIQRIIASGSL